MMDNSTSYDELISPTLHRLRKNWSLFKSLISILIVLWSNTNNKGYLYSICALFVLYFVQLDNKTKYLILEIKIMIIEKYLLKWES